MIVISIVSLLLTAQAQVAPAARTAAPATATPVRLTATGTFSDGTTRIFDVTAGDLDGDGKPDAAELHVTCSGSSVASAFVTMAPRDAASGLPSGRRQHKPYTMSATDPTPMAGVALATTYDLKAAKGARLAAASSIPVSLGDVSPAVCGAH